MEVDSGIVTRKTLQWRPILVWTHWFCLTYWSGSRVCRANRKSGQYLASGSIIFLGAWVTLFHNLTCPEREKVLSAQKRCFYACDIARNKPALGMKAEGQRRSEGNLSGCAAHSRGTIHTDRCHSQAKVSTDVTWRQLSPRLLILQNPEQSDKSNQHSEVTKFHNFLLEVWIPITHPFVDPCQSVPGLFSVPLSGWNSRFIFLKN